MEPMTLGSPVGSPAQTPASPSSSSAYLPSFLLGDSTPARVVISNVPVDSQKFSGVMTSPISTYSSPDYRHNRQKAIFPNPTSPTSGRMANENQIGGPPTRGLFDTIETTETSELSMNQSISRNQSRIMSGDPFFMDNPTPIGNNEPSQSLLKWITVFGFPPDVVNSVLSFMSSRIRIVDKHSPSYHQCNWIHLKCATEQEAQRALTCNGNIVSGSIMIGVIPCMDEGVILSPENDNRNKLNGSMRIFSSPNRFHQSSGDTSITKTPKRPNARPLASGYSQHLSPQAVKSPENVPQKSTGLVSKAMELVFGW